jgi:proline iminopeptidase
MTRLSMYSAVSDRSTAGHFLALPEPLATRATRLSFTKTLTHSGHRLPIFRRGWRDMKPTAHRYLRCDQRRLSEPVWWSPCENIQRMRGYAGGAAFETGLLDVGDGQLIYWEQSGNPAGKPLLILHGGPGGAPMSGLPTTVDPNAYLVVRFHQRGCGLSTPHAGDLDTSLEHNTTQHLIADIEVLREHLGIERWLVQGASWGVTLALAYAQSFPERVSELLLVSVTLTRKRDVRWVAHDTGRFFPEQWAAFQAGVPSKERHDLVAAYDKRINHHPEPAVRVKAAHDWCQWEDAIISLDDAPYRGSRTTSEAGLICFARLVTHYFAHSGFLDDEALLSNMTRLAGIPGVLIHGRFDLAGPPDVPWLVAQRWTGAELHLVRSGHTGNDEMSDQIRDAYERWETR